MIAVDIRKRLGAQLRAHGQELPATAWVDDEDPARLHVRLPPVPPLRVAAKSR